MSFEILNKLYPDAIPSASDFFSTDPQHGFTVSIVKSLTATASYKKAYEKFITDHWEPTRKPTRNQAKAPKEIKVEETKDKPALSLKK